MQLLRKSLLLLLGAALFFGMVGAVATWAPDKTVEELKPRWAEPPSQFVALEGMQVHLRDEGPRGDAVPIVLLHGTSASLHTWEGWAAALRGQRRVIRMDLPGFALTGPNASHDYSVGAYVHFVVALMNRMGVQRFVLVGNSLGGQIAWATALAVPQRVERLVLVDSAGYPFDAATQPLSEPIGFRLARTPGLRLVLQNLLPRGLVEQSVRDVYGDPTKVTPALVDLYFDTTLRSGNRQALGLRLDQRSTDDAPRIKELKLPTLILWGGRDRLLVPEFGRRFARDIAGSRLVMFDDLGHVPHEEDPTRTVAEVKRFLDS